MQMYFSPTNVWGSAYIILKYNTYFHPDLLIYSFIMNVVLTN